MFSRLSDRVVLELIDTVNLHIVFVSPRKRAHDTFHHLTGHLSQVPDHVITALVREWDYGDYEGLTPHEIKVKQPTWSIWKDGLVVRLLTPFTPFNTVVAVPTANQSNR
jgi:broad specificity phosphatase PhoE